MGQYDGRIESKRVGARFMQLFKYRYRPVHAAAEMLVSLTASLLPSIESRPLDRTPRKVLVLKFGGMGEGVLARSLVDRIRERHPRISFDFLVEKRTAEMMTYGSPGEVSIYSPGADGIIKALSILKEIRERHYDAVLDFEQHSLLTAAFSRATSIPVRVGFVPPGTSSRGRMFTHPIELSETESMWDAFIKIGRILAPELDEHLMTVPLHCSAEDHAWLREWLGAHVPNAMGPVVAMHLGVGPSAQYRLWPVERFASLARAIIAIRDDVRFVLTGATSERALIGEFMTRVPGKTIDASDVGSLGHTSILLRSCDLLISADTGIMHLGAAMGTPTVGLFGPNTPGCWAPVGPRATFVYPTRLPCSPCINSYRRQIPELCTATRVGACMLDITVDDVLRAARIVVKGSWLG